ncbi:hypothetical protein TrVE_jg6150 [Triparma verrucosa]|uniref:C2H2-type domain-containing protein n=1 Tax=Triparma verrucosa TaxID=1606542 RepID=A0A9W7F293_9STRA|nr:hypothetical protein TrVE_jg6150 [Triparma verrucosa]
MLVHGDDSTVAEDDLDDGSFIFAGGGARRGLVRDKWGKIIRTGGTKDIKKHKAAKHGIDVVWFSCDQDGCDYKAKEAGSLKKHKQNVHDIDVDWFPCDQDGCDYKAKEAGHLKQHKQTIHDIDVQWHRCDQDGCDFKAKQAGNLKYTETKNPLGGKEQIISKEAGSNPNNAPMLNFAIPLSPSPPVHCTCSYCRLYTLR